MFFTLKIFWISKKKLLSNWFTGYDEFCTVFMVKTMVNLMYCLIAAILSPVEYLTVSKLRLKSILTFWYIFQTWNETERYKSFVVFQFRFIVNSMFTSFYLLENWLQSWLHQGDTMNISNASQKVLCMFWQNKEISKL